MTTELHQQGIIQLRAIDQIMVVQNGVQKLLLIQSLIDALTNMVATLVPAMAVSAHTHPEADIVNLIADLTALSVALAGKAPLNHTHNIGDIQHNYVDATSIPPTTYNGVYPAIVKATVAGGNAVFQLTQDGTAGGAAIFASGPILNSPILRAEEGTNPCAFGVGVWSNGNKTLTVPVSRTGAALTILGLSVLGATVAANGAVAYATVFGR